MKQKVVIIGTGHGGIQAASSLREEGFEGEIVLISDEKEMPYQKPPLSKGFLQGKQTEDAILFRSINFYQNNDIDLRLGTKVCKIEPHDCQIVLENGEIISYNFLIIATGTSNRKLAIDGKIVENIYYLRNLIDAKIIEQKLNDAQNIVVIGGGFIGLELAALSVEKGKNVTVIEAQNRLMERVLPAVVSNVFYETHQKNGVRVLLQTAIENITDKEVTLKNGESIKADLILAGIGVIPETSFASEAGITCENGVQVNEFQQTNYPNIYAIGDCANHFNAFARKNLRLESVQNAVDQAKVAVNHILGKPQPYHTVPWFWTNQYQLKLQMAGINADYDETAIRGDINEQKFSIFYYKNQHLIAVDSLNRPADHLAARKLIQNGISPTFEQVADLALKLGELC
jgi:3-phenylpropionate/trans-cinnamate dioxygenase ferredoxin reductase component